MPLTINHTFDENTFRHSINGHMFVLHCHHYLSLTSKLAEDFADIGGTKVLREVAEDAIRPVFDSYFSENGISDPTERIGIATEYFAFMGLGLMKVSGDASGGEVTLSHSHVDEGWVRKWGKHDKPINHFACGFTAAMFGAAYDKPARSFHVSEDSSIAMGAPVTVLTAKAV